MAPTDVFVSIPGRVLTAVTALAAVLAVAALAGEAPAADVVLTASLGGLAVLAVWAVLGRPRVEVSDGTVVLCDVLRTVTIPWPTVVGTEVGWALTVLTTAGRWTAWGAPRSSAAAGAVARLRGGRHGRAASGEAARTLPASAEAAAAAIEARLGALRAAGHLRDAEAVAAAHGLRPTVRRHTGTVAAALLLAGTAAASRLG